MLVWSLSDFIFEKFRLNNFCQEILLSKIITKQHPINLIYTGKPRELNITSYEGHKHCPLYHSPFFISELFLYAALVATPLLPFLAREDEDVWHNRNTYKIDQVATTFLEPDTTDGKIASAAKQVAYDF